MTKEVNSLVYDVESRFFKLIFSGLKKYTNYKMRVTASTAVGESALSEENDVFVRTPEDGNMLFAMMIYFLY